MMNTSVTGGLVLPHAAGEMTTSRSFIGILIVYC